MACACRPFVMIATEPDEPKDAEVSSASPRRTGGDKTQWLPIPVEDDQAATRLAFGEAPVCRSATSPVAVLVSLSTVMRWLARRPGRAGTVGP
jgi:hypothetical protein